MINNTPTLKAASKPVRGRFTPARTHVGQEIVMAGSKPGETRTYLVQPDASLRRAVPKVNLRQAKRARARLRK